MKLKSLALLTMSLALTSMSFAQGFHVGLKAGATIFKINGTAMKDEFNFGYNAGAFAELYFSDKLGIQPEVMFNQTNYRTGTDFSNVYQVNANDVKGKLNYLSIPILLNYNLAKFFTLQAGPQFGILMNKHETLAENGKDAFKGGDFSMLGGVQLNIGSLKVGGRYVVGLHDINDLPNDQKWKNQGFQVYLGFRVL